MAYIWNNLGSFGQTDRAGSNIQGGLPTKWDLDLVFNADESNIVGKPSKKPEFPPGVMVSEQARAKLNEKQAQADAVSTKKDRIQQAQVQKWNGRPDVLQHWQIMHERYQAKKLALIAKWKQQDARKITLRNALIQKLVAQGASPNSVEARKQQFAQEDTVDTINKAAELVDLEQRQLVEVANREKNQIVKDKFYNFVAGFVGWRLRVIPA